MDILVTHQKHRREKVLSVQSMKKKTGLVHNHRHRDAREIPAHSWRKKNYFNLLCSRVRENWCERTIRNMFEKMHWEESEKRPNHTEELAKKDAETKPGLTPSFPRPSASGLGRDILTIGHRNWQYMSCPSFFNEHVCTFCRPHMPSLLSVC